MVTAGIVDNPKIEFDDYRTIGFQKHVLSYVGKKDLIEIITSKRCIFSQYQLTDLKVI